MVNQLEQLSLKQKKKAGFPACYGYPAFQLCFDEALDSTLSDSKHLGPTCGTYPLSRRLAILHGYALRILHFLFSTALNAICFK